MDLNLWKNKDELKKFLENLGTEYRYGCFEENNPQSCHLLADYLLSIEKERTKAAQLYKNNCDNNHYGLSCDAYGRLAVKGQGMDAPSFPLALEYFVKGCDQYEPRSCYHAGQLYGVRDKHVNKIIKPDPERAIELLNRACVSRDQPAACTLIHSYLLMGVHGKPADLKLAADYAKIACDQNQLIGCQNLSRMYHLGEGVEADEAQSKYYASRAKQTRAQAQRKLGTVNPASSDL